MPLYKLQIEGVVLKSITQVFKTIPTYKTLAEQYAAQFEKACNTYLGALNILDTMEEVSANTKANQLAGALALKEAYSTLNSNKLLWSGCLYMSRDHDVKLSENISKQANGIILVWCRYQDNAIAYTDYAYTFISKTHVMYSESNNRSVGCWMADSDGSIIAKKHLYISDNHIYGNDINARNTYTASGITFAPKSFVLVNVLGI